jgi:hypothetical protein
MNLESRLLRDFVETNKQIIATLGARLIDGDHWRMSQDQRLIDNLSLKSGGLLLLEVGERFVRIEQKTGRERVLVMSSKLKEVLEEYMRRVLLTRHIISYHPKRQEG